MPALLHRIPTWSRDSLSDHKRLGACYPSQPLRCRMQLLRGVAQFLGCCWRRCRFEPHADRRVSYGRRTARGVRLEFRRAPTGSPQIRRLAQIGIGANNQCLEGALTMAVKLSQRKILRTSHAHTICAMAGLGPRPLSVAAVRPKRSLTAA